MWSTVLSDQNIEYVLGWYQNCHPHTFHLFCSCCRLLMVIVFEISTSYERFWLQKLVFFSVHNFIVRVTVYDVGGCHALFPLIEIHDFSRIFFWTTKQKTNCKITMTTRKLTESKDGKKSLIKCRFSEFSETTEMMNIFLEKKLADVFCSFFYVTRSFEYQSWKIYHKYFDEKFK